MRYKKFIIFVAMIFLIVILLESVSAFAGGSGSSGSPYQISNCIELQSIPHSSTDYYILIDNIPCSATSGWNGGDGFLPRYDFGGNFNGEGYTITDLFINSYPEFIDYVGLFGTTSSSAVISNVGLIGVDVSTDSGNAGGLVGSNSGNIDNSYSTGSVTSDSSVGGLVGYNTGDISKSYSSVSVVGVGLYSYVGGLVGYNNGDIDNSYSTGSVTSGTTYGGLVGLNGGNIYKSYSIGSVYTIFSGGGFVGWDIDNFCFNSFWDTETSDWSTSACSGAGKAEPKTTVQMQTQSTFINAGWDFTPGTGIWVMDGYPHLQWEYCTDNDGDGYGKIGTGLTGCSGSNIDYDCIDTNTDCSNDYTGAAYTYCVNNKDTINPSAIEVCNDGVDNDCDNFVDGTDPDCAAPNCTDGDGDNYCLESSGSGCDNTGICELGWDDCNDNDPDNFPGNPEVCDGQDNDCDLQIDECLTPGDICISGTCATPSPYWAYDSDGIVEITIGISAPDIVQIVYLVLENPPPEVALWEFEIFENDTNEDDNDDFIKTLTGTPTNGKIIATWLITQTDIDNAGNEATSKFYFNVKGFSALRGTLEGNFSGTWERTERGEAGNGTWVGTINGDEASGIWEKTGLTDGTWNGSIIGQGSVSGEWKSTGLWGKSGTWDQSSPDTKLGTWERTIKEDDVIYSLESQDLELEWTEGITPPPTCNNNGVQDDDETGVDCGGPNCQACTEPDFCVDIPITICADYNSSTCSSNECGVGDCGTCSWNTDYGCGDSCPEIDSKVDLTIGTCNKYENDSIQDDCSNGFLTYAWIAEKIWDESNNFTTELLCKDNCSKPSCMSDNGIFRCPFTDCESGSDTVTCPTQVKLPLTNWFSIVAIVIIIALGYVLFSRDKKIKR